MSTIIYRKAVERELNIAFDFYFAIDPELAERFLQDYKNTVQRIQDFWKSEVKFLDTRRRHLKAFNYSIYFRVDEVNDILYIDAFIHNSRQQPGGDV